MCMYFFLFVCRERSEKKREKRGKFSNDLRFLFTMIIRTVYFVTLTFFVWLAGGKDIFN